MVLSEEEENKRLLNEAFPNFDGTFQDVLPTDNLEALEGGTEERIGVTTLDGAQQDLESVTKKVNVAELCRIHSQLFDLPSPWQVTSAHVKNMSRDIHEAFMCGYQAASLVHNLDKERTGTNGDRVKNTQVKY